MLAATSNSETECRTQAGRSRAGLLALALAGLTASLALPDTAAAAKKRKGGRPPAASTAAKNGGGQGQAAPVVVQGVDAADALNLRAEPNARSEWVAKIPPDARGLLATGRIRQVGTTTWREITYGEFTGWVNGKFLRADTGRWQQTPTLTSSVGGSAPRQGERPSLPAPASPDRTKSLPPAPAPSPAPAAGALRGGAAAPATPAAAAAVAAPAVPAAPAPRGANVPPAAAAPVRGVGPAPAAMPPSAMPPAARPGAMAPAGARPEQLAMATGAARPASTAPGGPSELDARRLGSNGGGQMGEYPGEKEFHQCKKLPAGKAVFKLNLKPDTDIGDLVGLMSSVTCTPILMASTAPLQGKKVTVIAPNALTLGEAYRLFYAALESVGLTIEPNGKFLRILDANKAKLAKMPYYGAGDKIPTDKRFITKLLRIEHLDANEVANGVLNRIKSEAGDIIPYRGSVIVTDTAENIERMARILKDFDAPGGHSESLWMIRVKNMSATEMAARLSEIVPVTGGGQQGAGKRGGGAAGPQSFPRPPMPPMPPGAGMPPGSPPGAMLGQSPASMSGGAGEYGSTDVTSEMAVNKIVPDERSNSILVVANKRAHDWLLALVRKLDAPIDGGSAKNGNGRVHVYYCENANCDELAQTLSAVAGVQVSGASGGGGGSGRRARTSTPGGPEGRAPMPPMPFPGGGAGGGGQSGNSLLFEGDVRITFDPPTNSLLVVSSFKDFQALRKVIEKLDGPRKQVFIEAMILEVLLDKSREVGVGYHGGKPVSVGGGEQSLLLGGFEASRTLSPTSLISNLGGLTGALFGPTIPSQNLQLFGTAVQLPSFGVFLQLLQTNNDVNVLSNPSLLITNNQEGEISVGENLPFPGQLLGGFGGGMPGAGGQQAGGGGFQAFPSVGVQRQNVALTMKITPSVNEHNVIRLDVDQVIEDVSAPNYNGLGPATSKRSAKTQVVARDQQTVVIGGLMTDRASETVKKVPILGDIPVLGFFFRSTSKTTKKANIIIALTPYVINDLSDLRRVAEKKLKERREFIERYSALEDKATFEKGIDYRRKRGMLEEINRAARDAEEDEAELQRVRTRDEADDSIQLTPASKKDQVATPPASAAPATPAAARPGKPAPAAHLTAPRRPS